MKQEAIDLINKYAEETLSSDNEDFNPQDYSGGNFDDAFNLGIDEGYRMFARYLKDFI
jgi:hypothetical protein